MKYIITDELLNSVVKAIGDLPVTWSQANPIISGLVKGLTSLPEAPVNQATSDIVNPLSKVDEKQ